MESNDLTNIKQCLVINIIAKKKKKKNPTSLGHKVNILMSKNNFVQILMSFFPISKIFVSFSIVIGDFNSKLCTSDKNNIVVIELGDITAIFH